MKRFLIAVAATALMGSGLSGCVTAAKTSGKVVALPFKATYHTGRLATKGVIGTTRFVGKSAVATGKGVYYVGTIPVKITDKALDTSSKILTVTTQMVDLTGKVVTVSRDIQALQLDAELASLRTAKNVISVIIDAA